MQQAQYCQKRKIDMGWLADAGQEYHSILVQCFKQELARSRRTEQHDEEGQASQREQLIDEHLQIGLCLSIQERKEELVIQKKSSITGSFLERIGRFENNILHQLKEKKSVKHYPPYQGVILEPKASDSKNWYMKGGDMARLVLDFGPKRSPVFVYMKDKNKAVKWQRYLVIEKILQGKEKLVAKCFEMCQHMYQEQYELEWTIAFEKKLQNYTTTLNKEKKKKANLDINFIVTMEQTVLKFHINKWRNRSDKYRQEELKEIEKRKQMTLEEQKQHKMNAAKMEELKLQREEKRKQMIANMKKYFYPREILVKNFFSYYRDRAEHYLCDKPNTYTFQFKTMLIEASIQMVRPQLEVRFVSLRTPNTVDFNSVKKINGQSHSIEQQHYFTCKLLSQMNQQRRRNYNTWTFKDGLLGLCGLSRVTVEQLGYKDYLDLQIVDTIKIGIQSDVKRIQLQDIEKYTKDGRTCWIPVAHQQSRIYVEIDIQEPKNVDPIYYDSIDYLEMSPVLRKISIKVIEQRTPIPIVETIKFTLEPERYHDDIQNLYQRLYMENICLQIPAQPAFWFQILEGKDTIVKGICEILKRNYLEFIDEDDNKQIYYQMKQLPNIRLPLIKDVEDYVNKTAQNSALTGKIQNMLNAYLIYCQLRQIQLNVGYLQTLFSIASKFMSLTHYHFFDNKDKEVPVFGKQYDSEAQAFWLFVAFVQLLSSLRYPISKADQIFSPQEIVLTYMEVLQKEIVMHCKNNDIPIENVLHEILASMFTNIVGSVPLYNILDLIIRKKSANAHQIVLIVFLEDLGDKLLFTTSRQDFFDAIRLQAQLMDIQHVVSAYSICEANLNRIINVKEVIVDSVQAADPNVVQMPSDH